MKNMNKIAVLTLALLAACASNGARPQMPRERNEFRASLGVENTNMKAKKTTRFFGQNITVTQKESGTAPSGRLEFSERISPLVTTGLYADLGHGELDTTAEDSVSIGGILRAFGSNERLRPFFEARGGYRATWIGETFGNGFDLGAALGLEYDVSKAVSIFVTGGYDYATTDAAGADTDFTGPAVRIGGAVRF